jgi:hypothetical protein
VSDDGGAADPDGLCDVVVGVGVAAVGVFGAEHRFRSREAFWGHDGLPPALATAGACGGEAGVGAFLDQGAFEFRERTEDVEDEPAAGARGIDLLGQRPEGDVAVGELAGELDEVGEGPAETVEAPNAERVAGPEELEGVVDELAGAGARSSASS